MKDLYYWLDIHPDCCDVDVDKIVRDRKKAEGIDTTSKPGMAAPVIVISDELDSSAKAAE